MRTCSCGNEILSPTMSRCQPCHNAYLRRYRAARGGGRPKDPKSIERGKARDAVKHEVAMGRMIKPEACEECGAVGPVEGHHPDYSKPLDVDWICKTCHTQRHHGDQKLCSRCKTNERVMRSYCRTCVSEMNKESRARRAAGTQRAYAKKETS